MDTNGKYSKDPLGQRMKEYEAVTRTSLPRRTYAIIRVDGKAFHTYTKGLERPFDIGLTEDMDATAVALCKEIQGAQFAYVQSDEISILITDFASPETQAWYGNGLQKMCSISAAVATAAFNQARLVREAQEGSILDNVLEEEFYSLENLVEFKSALFDSRVFQIPQPIEVENYFIWRQKDAVRNSISSVAQSLYSHKELEGVSSNQKQELIFQKGINWNDFDAGFKRGRMIVKAQFMLPPDARTGEPVIRNKWMTVGALDMLKDRLAFRALIPTYDAPEQYVIEPTGNDVFSSVNYQTLSPTVRTSLDLNG